MAKVTVVPSPVVATTLVSVYAGEFDWNEDWNVIAEATTEDA